jgi:hypothetical protein
MTLAGYVVENVAAASGGALISRRQTSESPPGQATTTFTGQAGAYDVVVAYFDENDGQSTLRLLLNGQEVAAWVADDDLPSNLPESVTRVERVVATGLALQPGDELRLEGQEDASEYARVDNLEFLPASGSAASAMP